MLSTKYGRTFRYRTSITIHLNSNSRHRHSSHCTLVSRPSPLHIRGFEPLQIIFTAFHPPLLSQRTLTFPSWVANAHLSLAAPFRHIHRNLSKRPSHTPTPYPLQTYLYLKQTRPFSWEYTCPSRLLLLYSFPSADPCKPRVGFLFP